MRILYSHRIQSRDGQSVHLEELIGALRAAGHEVMIVGPSAYARAGFGGESRAVSRIRRFLPKGFGEVAEIGYNFPAYLRLRRAAAAFRPDAIYERYNLFYVAGAALAARTGLPFLVEVNSPLADERKRNGMLSLERIARRMERAVWRRADRIFCVTAVLADMIAAQGAPRARIEVTQNGIRLEDFPDRGESESPSADIVLGFVGFVRAWHGLDAVLDAMARVPPERVPRLVVVGDGPARAELEQQARHLGIAERVEFTGLLGREAIGAALARFDIALQPKVVAYASPLKIFEYMAAGLAIVAPDQPNIREILAHGKTALLFDPDRPDAMWDAIAALIGDADLRRRLGRAAREDIVARDMTWRHNAARVAAAMEQARGRPSAR